MADEDMPTLFETVARERDRLAARIEELERLRQHHSFTASHYFKRACKAERQRDEAREALEELLDVAERIRGGDTTLDPERWYAARDFARRTLHTDPEPLPPADSEEER